MEVTKDLLDDELPDAEVVEVNERDNLVMNFYLWVHLPCWLVYGGTPTALLRQLAAGDKAAEKAAERLARLDHRVIGHAKFQRWIKADQEIARYRRKKA
jgi:hypothetical protein